MVADQVAVTQAIAQVAVEDAKAPVQAMAAAACKSGSGVRSEPTSMQP